MATQASTVDMTPLPKVVEKAEVTTSAEREKSLLQLPNEILYEILDHVRSTTEILALGRTCQLLRDIVNLRSASLSSAIIAREQGRIHSSLQSSSYNKGLGFFTPSVAGLSLLDALRKFIFHHGSMPKSALGGAMNYLVNQYMWDNGHRGTPTQSLQQLLEYLVYVDDAIHLNRGSNTKPAPSCHVCEGLRKSQSIMKDAYCSADHAVREFEYSRWHMRHPSNFYNGIASQRTEDFVTHEAWLKMVDSIIKEHLQHYSTNEVCRARMQLHTTVREATGSKLADFSMRDFLDDLALPRLTIDDDWLSLVYVPRMDVVPMRQPETRRESPRSLRATRELCLRSREGKIQRLLDPESRLLRAAVCEELLIQKIVERKVW